MRRGIGAASLLVALAACGGETGPEAVDQIPLVEFDTSRVHIVGDSDTLALRVEVASSPDQRQVGLMERSELAEDAGMIFLFQEDQPAEAGFWMFHTRIPLDIAYLDASGRIVSIRSMEPCESPDPRWCQQYPAGAPYRAALEVNQGFFERHGIEPGDRVLVPEELSAADSP